MYYICINIKNKIMNLSKFNFRKGDVVTFCSEYFFVIENNGSTGVVNPFGETFYIRNFYWELGNEITTFVRKPTVEELDRLGLK